LPARLLHSPSMVSIISVVPSASHRSYRYVKHTWPLAVVVPPLPGFAWPCFAVAICNAYAPPQPVATTRTTRHHS
jgi:hypothetical protein